MVESIGFKLSKSNKTNSISKPTLTLMPCCSSKTCCLFKNVRGHKSHSWSFLTMLPKQIADSLDQGSGLTYETWGTKWTSPTGGSRGTSYMNGILWIALVNPTRNWLENRLMGRIRQRNKLELSDQAHRTCFTPSNLSRNGTAEAITGWIGSWYKLTAVLPMMFSK